MTGGDHQADRVAEAALAAAFSTCWRRVIAAAFRVTGDLDLAEEAAAEVFGAACGRWRDGGVPRSVEAWLVTAARRRAIDQVRRLRVARAHLDELVVASSRPSPDPELDELRLLALCAGDDLPAATRVIMLLRFGCGISTATLAAMFHLPRATMAARLTRGRQRLQAELEAKRFLDADVESLLPVINRAIYLVFTAGTNPATGTEHTDQNLLQHADFLSKIVFRRWPGSDSAALRIMITLATDPSPEAVGHAIRLTQHVAKVTSLSTQAAIALEHAAARTGRERNWLRIAELYDVLLTVEPDGSFAVGRAVAIGHAFEPAVGLADLDELARFPGLSSYRYLHAARGAFLSELGRGPEAAAAYARAADLSANTAQSTFFNRRIGEQIQPGG